MNTQGLLFARMARLFAARAGIYCASVLLAGVAGIILMTLVALLGFRNGMQQPASDLWHSMTVTKQLFVIFGLLFALWMPVLLAARGVCRITAEQISGRPMTLGDVISDMLQFIPAAFVYSLIIGLLTMFSSAIFLVPGLLSASLFALVVPAGATETIGMFAALRKGVAGSVKVYGKVLLLTLASCILVVLVVALRILGIDHALPGSGVALFAARFTITYIPALLVLVLANICFTLLYLDTRQTQSLAAYAAAPPPLS